MSPATRSFTHNSDFILANLLALHGTEFIRRSYQVLLNREPDRDGQSYYLARLQNGMPKTEILRQIISSPEYFTTGTSINGLRAAIAKQRLSKIPFAGKMLSHLFNLEDYSSTAKRIRSIEQQQFAQLEKLQHSMLQIKESINDVRLDLCRTKNLITEDTPGTSPQRINADHNIDFQQGAATSTVVAISFYRNPHLTENIASVLGELVHSTLVHTVILINDSPDDIQLESILAKLSSIPKVHYIRNRVNLGYTRSINQAYSYAKQHGCNLLCVNSDVKFSLVDVEEVIAVSQLDDRIGFAFPRADSEPTFGLTGFLAESATHRGNFLPRYEFTPTAVGYFMLVKAAVVDRFDGFDEVFSPGYEEENDLVLRAGALGFRPALANHSLVHHATSSSFSTSADEIKQRHHAILLERHPYFMDLVRAYDRGAPQNLYRRLQRIAQKRSIIIDCYGFPPVLNGTSIYARELIKAINIANNTDANKIVVLVRDDVRSIMGIESLEHISFCGNPDELQPASALIRIGQPFQNEVIERALKYSACSINIFFDTLAQDIAPLRSADLEGIWKDITFTFENLIFISDASRKAFESRYPLRLSRRHVVYPSLKSNEYGFGHGLEQSMSHQKGGGVAEKKERCIFVVGNKFPHKDVVHTVQILLKRPELDSYRISVLSDSTLPVDPRLTQYQTGALPQEQIAALYSSCDFVIFPSFCEGFGLPLMEALHFRKPIIARQSLLNEELSALVGPIGKNIRAYRTENELFRIIESHPQWMEAENTSTAGWISAAHDVLRITAEAIENFDFGRRCEALRHAKQAH